MKIDPNLADAYSGIGFIKLNQKSMGWDEDKTENAEASFQQALALNPTLAEAHIGLIRVSYMNGKCEDGLRYGQKAASLGLEDADILSVRARAYYFAGIWDKAVFMYGRTIELDPANQDANAMIVPSYLFEGEYRKAIEAGDMFYRKFRDAPGRVHYFMALAYHCLGDFASAKRRYEQAIQQAPEDTLAYAILGFLLKQHGQPAEAQRIWRQGLAILKLRVDESPQNPGVHGRLALFYGQLGDKAALLKEEDWILREAPDNGNALVDIGDAFARLGEPERAVEYYRRGLHMGFLTFSPRAFLKVDGTEKLDKSPAYEDFINELTQITNRLREQY